MSTDKTRTKACPRCGTTCAADFVDIGVGEQKCGPWVCADQEGCGWVEPHLTDEQLDLIADDEGPGI